VDAWFYRAIAGLKCREPGWKKIVIKPPLFGDLREASAKVETVRGEARVSWRNEETFFDLAVRIPVGSEAEIQVPLIWDEATIKEGERAIWRGEVTAEKPGEISFLKRDDRYVIFAVGSGTYHFLTEKT